MNDSSLLSSPRSFAPAGGLVALRPPRWLRPGTVAAALIACGLLVAAAALAWDAPIPIGQRASRPWYVLAMLYPLYAILLVICVYTVRHYWFTLNRLHGVQRHPYLDIDTADWPEVTVLVPAHNEEPVMEGVLTALLDVDYPPKRLHILPVDDRSKDRTGAIVDEFAARHPGMVVPFHRTKGEPGKAAALRDAMALVTTDIALVFDADYIPGRGLIKQLVAPFFDPEVGAVMGRVVPHNVGQNLLTRLLDLERTGGYQVDQQARMNLKLVPQYGGTVGGVRRRALESVGGWRIDTLAEDTDATFRLLRGGWKTVYQNRSECYEQVPTSWPQRMRQVRRWARGHNEALFAHAGHLLTGPRTRFREKLDGWLLLNVYMMSPIVMLGWLLAMALWYLGENRPGLIIILIVTSYSVLGNFATFFEVSAGSYLDGSRARIRLLPLVMLGFLVGLFTITHETVMQVVRPREPGARVRWSKTEHPHAISDEEDAWP
jgi:cellulose synthase/poly-beta-1,6-N-acetylglucosamine synthase-like glycosyltransferase